MPDGEVAGAAGIDPVALPDGLPVPLDDGAADHLSGRALPKVSLRVARGGVRRLDDFSTRWLILYVYPRTGGPGVVLPPSWDMIPGARGCTPQSCAFRDHAAELAALGATVRGVSAQPIEEQAEFAERMHIPFELLNDSRLILESGALSLPTFDAAGMTLYKRLTMIASRQGIAHVFYPVFPPDRNAAEVIAWLREFG